MKSLLAIEQLSQRLHKSVASICNDASRSSQSLPPICRLFGTERFLWRIAGASAGWARRRRFIAHSG